MQLDKATGKPLDRPVTQMFEVHTAVRFTGMGSVHTLRVVDGVGMHYFDRKGQPPATDQEVRNHLIGLKQETVLVEADSLAEALNRVMDCDKGFQTGDRARATVFSNGYFESGVAIENPRCDRMHWVNGSLSCTAAPEYYREQLQVPAIRRDTPCGCILEGFSPPDDCPIKKFREA